MGGTNIKCEHQRAEERKHRTSNIEHRTSNEKLGPDELIGESQVVVRRLLLKEKEQFPTAM
jgi:hypothetical protein